MIQAEHLRLNNWVLFGKEADRITGVYESDTVQKDWHVRLKTGECPLDRITPIQLTEEILIKCGFERSGFLGDAFSMKDSYLFLCFYDDNKEGVAVYMRRDNFYLKTIKTLHDLQNYWYYTTGTELEIEL